ncbi:MAG TPA: ankyrin repeat domain-containing protein [Thermoanaerobaculia bacterium]|jgi:hypothetical protein
MKKGCLLWLLQLAALVGLYYLAFRDRFTPPADWIGALAGGFFLLLAIGAFRNVAIARRNRARLDRALAGVPFEDGQQVAAIGPIMALGAPIESPFSRTPCVVYSYDVSHESTTRTSRGTETSAAKDFSGFALTPCVVNAPGGNVRILGFPTLEGFAEEPQRGDEAFTNAESYLRSTPFERIGITKIFSQVKDLLTDEDGYIRKDWRMAGEGFQLDPEEHTLNEQVVEDGETVCALGRYSAEKGGLIPGFSQGGEGLTLIRGGREEAEKRLKGNARQYVAAGIAILLASHFFLFMFLVLREPSVRAEREEVQESALLQAAQNGDAAAVEARLGEDTEADARDSESNTPLMLTRDPEIARRLIAAGADVNARNRSGSTPLIEAAKNGATEVARLLVRTGADLEARDTQWNMAPLAWALHSEQPDVAQVLRNAGAKEPEGAAPEASAQ